MRTAVALIIFNRADVAARVLAAIREARPPVLFVIADGPRAERVGESERCARVRELVETGVDWPCDVRKVYSDANLGCAERVASGLNWVFDHVNEAIILEDDCLPDASFFRFCEELLERFRDDERVAQIAGCSFQRAPKNSSLPSYYFSRYPHCWGWATWRRAWRHYDHDMSAWSEGEDRDWFFNRVKNRQERKWWTKNFDATRAGRTNSWAFRWTMVIFKHDWLSVLPYRNLVTNLGFGPEATHTRDAVSEAAAVPINAMCFPLSHPYSHQIDHQADSYSSKTLFRTPTLQQRCLRKAGRILKILVRRRTR